MKSPFLPVAIYSDFPITEDQVVDLEVLIDYVTPKCKYIVRVLAPTTESITDLVKTFTFKNRTNGITQMTSGNLHISINPNRVSNRSEKGVPVIPI